MNSTPDTASDPKQRGYAWVTPAIVVPDVLKTVAFYEAAFEGFRADAGNKDTYGVVRYRDVTIMVTKQGAFGPGAESPATTGHTSPMNLYVYVDDVDAFLKKAVAAGAKATMEPQDVFYGDRIASLVDPDGYTWVFATRSKDESHMDEEHKQARQKQQCCGN